MNNELTMAEIMKILDTDEYDRTFITRNGNQHEAYIKREPVPQVRVDAGKTITLTDEDGIMGLFKVIYVCRYPNKLSVTLEKMI